MARYTREIGLKRRGWVEYPHGPRANGNFHEDLPLIISLVGAMTYEYTTSGGVFNPVKFWIRRVD